ncbi:MAG: stage III sporulation protein AD [Lachnospiraceae bacterium]|nr:stage III sporulation protein AD [Lachnospiraceae bacterium]
MEEIVKVGIIGILGVLTAIQFKAVKPEYSTYIGVALGLLIFGYTVQQLRTMLGSLAWMKALFEGSGGYLTILMKVIGITYLCEFSAGICKDAGYGAIAEQVEVLGKLSVMFAGLPILLAVVEQIQGYMG